MKLIALQPMSVFFAKPGSFAKPRDKPSKRRRFVQILGDFSRVKSTPGELRVPLLPPTPVDTPPHMQTHGRGRGT
jgi:hypothetical protein